MEKDINIINKRIDYWLALADDNIQTAAILLENNKYLDTGFYCHQVIEKALKAYYWSLKHSEPPYIHNLIRLSEISGLLEKMSEEQKNILDLLMPLNIEGRYPDEIIKDFSEQEISTIAEIRIKTEELFLWIKSFLKK